MDIRLNQTELVATVERIAADLDQANQDIALMRRLKTAEADAKRLAVELRTAQEQLADRNAKDIVASREAVFAGFEDIVVRENPATSDGSLMHVAFEIVVTRREWDGYRNEPKTQIYSSFLQLPDEAFNYLLEKHPGRIPAKVMALHPDDAWEAFREYFVSLRRGYFTNPIAA